MHCKYGNSLGEAACRALKGICKEEFGLSGEAESIKGVSRDDSSIVVTLPFYGTLRGHYLMLLSKECAEQLVCAVDPEFDDELKYSILSEILNTAVGEAVQVLLKDHKDISIFSPIISGCPLQYPSVDGQKVTLKSESGHTIDLYLLLEHQITAVSGENLKDVVKQVYEATEIRGHHLEILAHKLKTPLNSVMGFADVLLSESLSSDQLDILSSLKQSGQSMAETIDSLMDFMEINEGKVGVSEHQFNLENCVADLVEKYKSRTGEKDHEISVDINGVIPFVVGDGAKISRVLDALLDNAVKFTPKGKIHLNIAPVSSNFESQTLRFSVKDTGPGISAKNLSEILQPFGRADYSITRSHDGIGLGLSVAQGLLKLLNSGIIIDSKEGEGSDFSFDLTLKLAGQHKSGINNYKGKRAVILSDADTGQLETFLHETEITFEKYKSLHEFLRGSKVKFDVLILDQQKNDLILTNQAFARNKLTEKVVNIISEQDSEVKNKLVSMGLSHFLCKPYGSKEAEEVFRRVFKISDGVKRRESKGELNILVAEDNVVNQLVIKKVFDLLGHKITLAKDGVEALEFLEKKRFDLVFMDLQMPRMDGLEATSRIRSDKRFKDLLIIALSANLERKFKEQCREVGMNGYISKPFKLDKIKAVLNLCIKQLNQQNQCEKFSLFE